MVSFNGPPITVDLGADQGGLSLQGYLLVPNAYALDRNYTTPQRFWVVISNQNQKIALYKTKDSYLSSVSSGGSSSSSSASTDNIEGQRVVTTATTSTTTSIGSYTLLGSVCRPIQDEECTGLEISFGPNSSFYAVDKTINTMSVLSYRKKTVDKWLTLLTDNEAQTKQWVLAAMLASEPQ